MNTPCFVVTGYNNTRIYDIAKLRPVCAAEYGAKVVLVTERVGPLDRLAADAVIVAPLGEVASGAAVEPVVAELGRLGLRPVGILPFSDRGVPLGAWLARHFGLPGADPDQARAGLDKRSFRAVEAAAAAHPAGYTPLESRPVRTREEFEAAVAGLGGSAFVKPANEGNSRGCQVVPEPAACAAVWASLEPYHEAGVIVETWVREAREYSWDYVAGTRWLTGKRTTEDRFRAEIQQIVPAPLEPESAALLDRAGQHVREMVSTGNGAFHNELFLRDGEVSAVETNMRPGGMYIWDLAKLAFEDFDPWRAWLRWAVDGVARPGQPVRKAVSGVRMLRAPRDGVLRTLPDAAAVAAGLDIPVHEAVFTAAPGDRVSADVADNSGFVGHVVLVAEDAKTLTDRFDALAAALEVGIGVDGG
jgi:hypothetical protein